MAGLIPNDFIDSLLARTDIVEVIGSHIDLKKKGKDHWACCPFHNENSPSFSVNSSKQFYYCFGCGATGTALTFIREYSNLGFVESVELLAQRAGVEVPRAATDAKTQQQQQRRKSQVELMSSCADYYAHQLLHHPHAREAQQYVRRRQLSSEVVKTFQLGFAPAGWDNLSKHFGTDQSNRDLLQTGMLSENEQGKIYDRFRRRLMFPIRNLRGQVIAFGGRVLSSNDKPKYLNSPETAIFKKGQELYGLYEARKASRDLEQILVVEGYMDVVALAQQGISNAVATLGTAISANQVEQLFRQTSEIIYCFDGDAAGRRAAVRALANTLGALKDGLQAKFVFLPEGEDPDSLVKREGVSRFRHRIDQAQSLPDFLFQHLQTQADVSRLDGKARLATIAQGWINKTPPGVLRQLLLDQLASLVGLSVAQLQQQFAAEEPKTPTEAVDPIDSVRHPLPEQGSSTSALAVTPSESGLMVKISPVQRALTWLLRFPQLAESISPQMLQELPQTPDVELLGKAVSLLKSAQPALTQDLRFTYDYLCQHGLRSILLPVASSDYLWLGESHSERIQQLSFARQELEKIILALKQRAPDEEYLALKARVTAMDPSLSEADNQRYLALLRERKD